MAAPEEAKPAPLPRMPVFFDWELAIICNYRCSYCPLNATDFRIHGRYNVFPGLERLREVWTRIHGLYGSCHIQLAGGESSTYPRFYELTRMLTGLHTLTFVTNLSFDVERFSDLVDLSRIKITASFHPEFADRDEFLRKCLYLKGKGLREDIAVTCVGYPDHLPSLKKYKKIFNEAGLEFRVDPFNGVYKNKSVYPAGYTEEERALIIDAFSDGTRDGRQSLERFNWRGHAINSTTHRLIKKANEERRKSGEAPLPEKLAWEGARPFDAGAARNSDGKSSQAGVAVAPMIVDFGPSNCRAKEPRKPVLCHMGQKYAKIRKNGDAFRCCAQPREDRPSPIFEDKHYLGNIFFDDDFKLLTGPAWCDFEPCPCDRCMLAGEHDRWGDLWSAPQASRAGGRP